jgi:3-oxoisoapionate decarboxylase
MINYIQKPMILGIGSYTFTWAVGVPGHIPPYPLDEMGLIGKASELGVGLIQIADNLPLDKMDDKRIDKLVSAAAASGMMLEAGSNRMTADRLEQYIGIADRIGSGILRFVIDGEGYAPPLNQIVSIIRDAEPELKRRNIILALENHDRLLSREFAEIIERAGTSNAGICLDCANSLGAGEGIREVVETLAPYTVNLHLKEILIRRKFHRMGFDVEGKPFGQGQLPLEWILSKLTNACRTAIVELWTPPEENIEGTILKESSWAGQSIRYLRNFISG